MLEFFLRLGFRNRAVINSTVILRNRNLGRIIPQIKANNQFQCVVMRGLFCNQRLLGKREDHRKHMKNKSEQDEPEDKEEYTSNVDIDDIDGKNVTLVKARVTSLRLDNILKAGLRLAKNKIETAFYESKIRVNGEKPLKKSKQLHIGDEIDFLVGKNATNPEYLDISRIQIVSANYDESDEEKIQVVLKYFKSLTIESYKS